MDTLITLEQIDYTNFRSATEIWLGTPPDTGHCLWRGRPVVTHDMLSEGTHDQNVNRIWLPTPSIVDLPALQSRLAARLASQNMQGEFYPAQLESIATGARD